MAKESDMNIGRVQRTARLPALIAGELADQIKAGKIKPGEQLPVEPELAARFGVSRTVVREAVARLRSDGVVRSRQGAGVFVSDRSPQTTLRINRELLLDKARFAQLFELRTTLEITAAGLAAERRDSASTAEIRSALQRLRNVPGTDSTSVEADLDFHHAIALAANNTFMAEFIRFISAQIRESISETRRHRDPDDSARRTYEEHEAIFAAIRKGDPATAKRAMRRHLANGFVRLCG